MKKASKKKKTFQQNLIINYRSVLNTPGRHAGSKTLSKLSNVIKRIAEAANATAHVELLKKKKEEEEKLMAGCETFDEKMTMMKKI